MKKDTQLSAAGAEIVVALNGFLTALREGGDLTKRFTVRTYDLRLEPRVYTGADVKKTRMMLGLSQALFARFLGASVGAVRAWERGDNELPGMASRFLDEINHSPEHWKKRISEMIVEKGKRSKNATGRQACES